MSSTVERLKNYPEELHKAAGQALDSDLVWKLLLSLHDEMIAKLKMACRARHPDWTKSKVDECARLSLLNYLSNTDSKNAENEDGFMVYLTLREWLLGDLTNAEGMAKTWMLNILKQGGFNSVIKKMNSFAQMGEKFVSSDGHKTKAQNSSERQAELLIALNKLLQAGTDKTAAYQRLSVRFGITVRQIQRVVKKNK